MKRAILTGITGQDGWYASDLLARKGYEVFGLTHRATEKDHREVHPAAMVFPWTMNDQAELEELIRNIQPCEIYNFAAFSSGSGMFDDPVAMGNTNGLAVTRILEAIRAVDPSIRFCQASSSEMFGEPLTSPQNERTPFNPRSPYGAAKVYAHGMINIYRERYGLMAGSAILYNHESPRRSPAFVTRKITAAAAGIKLGLSETIALGNLDARRDWGFAGDFVDAMWRMLQAPAPDDYVIATGTTHSVRELCEYAFGHVGLDYRDHVLEDSTAFRKDETLQLVGDATKAASELGWTPTIQFPELVRMMVDTDLNRFGESGQN